MLLLVFVWCHRFVFSSNSYADRVAAEVCPPFDVLFLWLRVLSVWLFWSFVAFPSSSSPWDCSRSDHRSVQQSFHNRYLHRRHTDSHQWQRRRPFRSLHRHLQESLTQWPNRFPRLTYRRAHRPWPRQILWRCRSPPGPSAVSMLAIPVHVCRRESGLLMWRWSGVTGWLGPPGYTDFSRHLFRFLVDEDGKEIDGKERMIEGPIGSTWSVFLEYNVAKFIREARIAQKRRSVFMRSES